MRILNRLRAEINELPPAVAWLAAGPAPTKNAVLATKKKLLFVQLPLALAIIGAFSALRAMGAVEAEGHVQLIFHFCATATFLWPPTLFSVSSAAWRDIQDAPHQFKKNLRVLALASGFIAALSTLTLSCLAILYMHTMYHYL